MLSLTQFKFSHIVLNRLSKGLEKLLSFVTPVVPWGVCTPLTCKWLHSLYYLSWWLNHNNFIVYVESHQNVKSCAAALTDCASFVRFWRELNGVFLLKNSTCNALNMQRNALIHARVPPPHVHKHLHSFLSRKRIPKWQSSVSVFCFLS